MNTMSTRRTAILVDGGYYRKRAEDLWGKKSPQERADEIFKYCMLHISEPKEPRDLYRIFYYDCPPMTRKLKHPLTGEEIDYSAGSGTKWTNDLYSELACKRKIALRMGELAENVASFKLKDAAMSEILSGKRDASQLVKSDFYLDVKQKGVDMRIGLDAASIAFGRYVDQIVLIAGDSDFLPVAKMARRNGIDFILDPMKQMPKKNLQEHIDGMETFTDLMYPRPVENGL